MGSILTVDSSFINSFPLPHNKTRKTDYCKFWHEKVFASFSYKSRALDFLLFMIYWNVFQMFLIIKSFQESKVIRNKISSTFLKIVNKLVYCSLSNCHIILQLTLVQQGLAFSKDSWFCQRQSKLSQAYFLILFQGKMFPSCDQSQSVSTHWCKWHQLTIQIWPPLLH